MVAGSHEVASPAPRVARPGRLRAVADRVIDPVTRFFSHDPMTLAASIAFYSALSFAPIIVLALWLASFVSPGTEQRFIEQLGGLLGSQVGDIAQVVTQNADRKLFQRSAAGVVSVITLAVSASTAFAQLQAAINAIWGVTVKPNNAVWSWIRRRLLSFGMIAVIGFLLITALVASSVMSVVLSREGAGWAVANELVTLGVFTAAFAGLFRFVPDARVPLRYAVAGGAVTALLFVFGKWGLAVYLGSTTTADAYGAASSLILMLVWVYYSSVIVLIGASATRAIAEHFGDGLVHLEHSRVESPPPPA